MKQTRRQRREALPLVEASQSAERDPREEHQKMRMQPCVEERRGRVETFFLLLTEQLGRKWCGAAELCTLTSHGSDWLREPAHVCDPLFDALRALLGVPRFAAVLCSCSNAD